MSEQLTVRRRDDGTVVLRAVEGEALTAVVAGLGLGAFCNDSDTEFLTVLGGPAPTAAVVEVPEAPGLHVWRCEPYEAAEPLADDGETGWFFDEGFWL